MLTADARLGWVAGRVAELRRRAVECRERADLLPAALAVQAEWCRENARFWDEDADALVAEVVARVSGGAL